MYMLNKGICELWSQMALLQDDLDSPTTALTACLRIFISMTKQYDHETILSMAHELSSTFQRAAAAHWDTA